MSALPVRPAQNKLPPATRGEHRPSPLLHGQLRTHPPALLGSGCRQCATQICHPLGLAPPKAKAFRPHLSGAWGRGELGCRVRARAEGRRPPHPF